MLKKHTQEIYDNLTNEEVIQILANCMEVVQQRQELRDYLTEQTYNNEDDIYEYDYDDKCFESYIKDCKKYLASNEYQIANNKKGMR